MFRHRIASLALTCVIGILGATPRGALPTPAPPPVLPKVPNVASGYAAPPLAAPNPEIVGVLQQPFVGITLQNAVAMALSHDTDLAVAQANRRIAGYQIEAARGAYDVRLAVEPSYRYSASAPINPFFAGPNFGPLLQKTASLKGGVSGILRGGGSYSLTVQGSRQDDNTTVNSFDPSYPAIFSVQFRQPLARGAGITDASRTLQLARIGADASNWQTLAAVSSTITRVDDTYWDLVAAWRNLAIQEEALKEAVLQQASNRRLAARGANAPIDVVQSGTQVDVFQSNVYSAVQQVAALQNALKSLLLSDPQDPIWNANLVPTTPVLQLPVQPTLSALIERALRNRPEIARIRDERRSADVDLRYAENALKPQIDVQVGYSSDGFAGQPTNPNASPFAQSSAAQAGAIDQLIAAVNRTLPANAQIPFLAGSNTPVPGYLVGGLDRSIENLLNNRFPTYAVGLSYTLPLGDHTARAQFAAARERERLARVQEAATIETIAVQVRDALQAFRSAQYRLIAARSARRAAQDVLASERRRFRAGASTTFLVLQRQVELANDRGLELQAQTDLNKAVVALEQATGTILSDNNVSLTTVGEEALQP